LSKRSTRKHESRPTNDKNKPSAKASSSGFMQDARPMSSEVKRILQTSTRHHNSQERASMMRSLSTINQAWPRKGRPMINEAAPLTTIRTNSAKTPKIFEMVLLEMNLDQAATALKRKSPARRLVSL
jgi:hypothetical protein